MSMDLNENLSGSFFYKKEKMATLYVDIRNG